MLDIILQLSRVQGNKDLHICFLNPFYYYFQFWIKSISIYRRDDVLFLFFFLKVHSHVDIYNFTDNTWGERFDMPKEMAHSHLGMVTDGRYIYIVTGQYGPQCRGPTASTFVLDTSTKQWQDFPSLPVPR